MKVVLTSVVSADAEGGSAAYIRWLGNHLVEQNNTVLGISRLRYDNSIALTHDQSENRETLLQTSTNQKGWHTNYVRPRPWMRPIIRNLLPMLSRSSSAFLAIALYRLAYNAAVKEALSIDCDIVHHTGTGWDLLGFATLSAARRKGALFTITPFVHPQVWGDAAPDIRLYNAADAVFCCSDFERNHLIKLGVQPRLLQRTAMAPATTLSGNALEFRKRYGLENRIVVLFLGRKQKYKGYHSLRTAMLDVIKEFPNVCLVAAGTETEPPYPDLPVENFLDLGSLGGRPEELQEKADALAASDIFCMPSTAEAFGLVYAEAWAYRTPVIGGSAPALIELIDEGVNGFRVTQDPAAISDKIIQLCSDAALRKSMGDAGYEKQQKYFTWNSVVARHLQVWREICNVGITTKLTS